jgi:hypothetical protein
MWADYRASLEKYDAPDLDWNSLAGLGTWSAYTAFKNVVEGMSGDINNVTFLAAANATTALDTDGMIGTLDLTKPYTGFGGGLPRVTVSAVGWDSSGNSSRLPGWVVMVVPSGSVQSIVPSGYCWLDQPGQKVFMRWCSRHRQARLDAVVGPQG